jgi:hypothetical protein
VLARGLDRDARPGGESVGNRGPGGCMTGTAGFDMILYFNLEPNKYPSDPTHEKHDSEKM